MRYKEAKRRCTSRVVWSLDNVIKNKYFLTFDKYILWMLQEFLINMRSVSGWILSFFCASQQNEITRSPSWMEQKMKCVLFFVFYFQSKRDTFWNEIETLALSSAGAILSPMRCSPARTCNNILRSCVENNIRFVNEAKLKNVRKIHDLNILWIKIKFSFCWMCMCTLNPIWRAVELGVRCKWQSSDFKKLKI